MKKILLLAFLIPFIIIGQTPSDEDNISTTEDCICGDINNDGSINITDLVSYLGSILSSDIELESCHDLDKNGGIDILDVIITVNHILGTDDIICDINDVSSWSDSSVTDMSSTFENASSFSDQDACNAIFEVFTDDQGIFYESDVEITGFQIEFDEVIESVEFGNAFGWTLSSSDNNLLGFGFDGSSIPPSSYILLSDFSNQTFNPISIIFSYSDDCEHTWLSSQPCVTDDCGVCDGDNTSCLDDCGVANGDNSSCADDCGVPNGDNSSCVDCCGVANGDGTSCDGACGPCNDESSCNGFLDCLGYDATGYLGWLGDGICDDGTYGLYFNCEEYDFDGGDCIIYGCTDVIAFNYNSEANTDNNSCYYNPGCTDPIAWNFDPLFDFDDDSCYYNPGCTDPIAWNFDPLFDFDDDSCIIYGCTNSLAPNYSDIANTDDGSCLPVVYGCTDENALNYNESANVGLDGLFCLYVIYGCTDESSCNYDPIATDDYQGLLCDYLCLDECGVANGDNSSCADECGVPMVITLLVLMNAV